MKIEEINLKTNNNIVMTAYILDMEPGIKSNLTKRPAVLIFPGGSYHYTSNREAEPIAMSFLAEGFNAFILRYSVGKNAQFSEALQDAEEALQLIREKADDWYVDQNKITVAGFSAGGHLAAALGTMGAIRPNALLLGYPCILDKESLAFRVPNVDEHVDAMTPPTFLFSTFEDDVVPIEHSLRFLKALDDKNIPFESHIFQYGPHGFSLGKYHTSFGTENSIDSDFAQWLPMSLAWLHRTVNVFSKKPED